MRRICKMNVPLGLHIEGILSFYNFCKECYDGSTYFRDFLIQISGSDRINIGNSCNIVIITEMVKSTVYHSSLGLLCSSPRVIGIVRKMILDDTRHELSYQSLALHMIIRPNFDLNYQSSVSFVTSLHGFIPIDLSESFPLVRDQVIRGAITAYIRKKGASIMYGWLNCTLHTAVTFSSFGNETVPLMKLLESHMNVEPNTNTQYWVSTLPVRCTGGLLSNILSCMNPANKLDLLLCAVDAICIDVMSYILASFSGTSYMMVLDEATYGISETEAKSLGKRLQKADILSHILKQHPKGYKVSLYDTAASVLLDMKTSTSYLLPNITDLNSVTSMKCTFNAATLRHKE